jgi:2-polyprenyl-3-methyl-5-hydroxy-6-metoxy-1,4-benzoquinol methylase
METNLVFKHPLPQASLVRERNLWLREQCSGKKVLHVGCVDAGLLGDRTEEGTLLHAQLEGVCAGLVGVDVDSEGVAAMKQMGFTNLFTVDVSKSPSTMVQAVKDSIGGCDVILCGEVLEHVPNMGSFLSGIHEIGRAFGAKTIVTVPNAFSIRLMAGILTGIEWVHPDHKCYFSSITMRTLLSQSGFSVQRMFFYTNPAHSSSALRNVLKSVFDRSVFRWYPQLAEGLIVTAKTK